MYEFFITSNSVHVEQNSQTNKTHVGIGPIKLPPLSTGALKSHGFNDAQSSSAVDGRSVQKMFTNRTKAIVWGMQTRAVQSMLDFDFICRYVMGGGHF